jgi:hypothetical protein
MNANSLCDLLKSNLTDSEKLAEYLILQNKTQFSKQDTGLFCQNSRKIKQLFCTNFHYIESMVFAPINFLGVAFYISIVTKYRNIGQNEYNFFLGVSSVELRSYYEYDFKEALSLTLGNFAQKRVFYGNPKSIDLLKNGLYNFIVELIYNSFND